MITQDEILSKGFLLVEDAPHYKGYELKINRSTSVTVDFIKDEGEPDVWLCQQGTNYVKGCKTIKDLDTLIKLFS